MSTELILCKKQELVDVAEAVRNKTGNSKTMLLTEIPNQINSIQSSFQSKCELYFPENGMSGCTIYYTDISGAAREHVLSGQPTHLYVLKDSIVTCSSAIFDNITFIIDATQSDVLNRSSIRVRYATQLEYADGAPT